MQTSELDYDLPEELIAQRPAEARDGARMMVVADDGALAHRAIVDLPDALPPSLLVINDTRVIPARLLGTKQTGGRIELLLLRPLGGPTDRPRWSALARASKPPRAGARLTLGDGRLSAVVLSRADDGSLEVELGTGSGSIDAAIEAVGIVPLPPYIRRAVEPADRERYQTVYAARPGAVAAPTAGLHLSQALMAALEARGHRFARVTLHVGLGTFAPVKAASLHDHRMHAERFEVPEPTAAAIAEARAERRAVVAVGTTVVRALEAVADPDGHVAAGAGETRLLIAPPYRPRVVEGLLTNFHLPRSTLLALVMAFAGIEPTRRAYAEAVRSRYRFFSYGDAMLILPHRTVNPP